VLATLQSSSKTELKGLWQVFSSAFLFYDPHFSVSVRPRIPSDSFNQHFVKCCCRTSSSFGQSQAAFSGLDLQENRRIFGMHAIVS